MSEFALQLAAALALTIVIECAVVALLGARRADEFAAVAAVNVITNPALNVLVTACDWVGAVAVSRLGASDRVVTLVYVAIVGIAEIAVVLIEWRLLLWTLGGRSRAWLVRSAVMNATSLLLGSWLLAQLAEHRLI